jgi:hypothetical protein
MQLLGSVALRSVRMPWSWLRSLLADAVTPRAISLGVTDQIPTEFAPTKDFITWTPE